MATYLNTNGTSETFDLTERYIYGSSRVGVYKEPVSMLAPPSTPPFNYVRPGYRQYELSNHLGNVTTTITAQKVPLYSGTTITGFAPQIVKSFDYSPFGVTRVDYDVTARLGGGFEVDYGVRYGFNGMEKDDEIKGFGNSYDFGARMLDPRLGRWLSIDPFAGKYVPISPYVFTLNNPIIFVDEDGKEVIGADGNPVSYSRSSSGQIEWSANATADIRVLGDAMLQTTTGTAQFKKMQDSRLKIMLVYDVETPASALRSKDGIKLGDTRHPWVDPNPLDLQAEITMNPGKVTVVKVYANSIKDAISDGTVDGVEGISYRGALGIVASHEAEHAADSKNINVQQQMLMLRKYFGDDPELNMNAEAEHVPEAMGRKAGQESVDLQPTKITPKSLPIPSKSERKLIQR